MGSFNLYDFLISLPGLIIALTFHEYAHAVVADYLGDDTPRYQGRLTINPIAHLDLIGFIMLAWAHFGWAKPVQVNPVNFRRDVGMRKGMMLVSLGGPGMNLLMVILGVVIMRMFNINYIWPWENVASASSLIFSQIINYNLFLGFFNLIPVPPLDGSKILAGLLPADKGDFIYDLERYGMIILIILVFSGLIGKIIDPPVYGILKIIEAFLS
ncbi:MAG: site-2 protease family protein [Chitinophagales bacterium]